MRLLRVFMLGLAALCASAVAQKAGEATFPPEQIKAGAEIYATNCATCHGNRMENPPWALDLATIPKNDRRRFVEFGDERQEQYAAVGRCVEAQRYRGAVGLFFDWRKVKAKPSLSSSP